VAVGNEGALVTSDDGITWTPRASGTDERLRGVAYGNGRFVTVGYAGTVLTSRDGTVWKRRPRPTVARLMDLAFGNGLFVAVGWQGTILNSDDGSRWRQVSSGTSNHLWRVTFGDASSFVTEDADCGNEASFKFNLLLPGQTGFNTCDWDCH